MGANQALQLLNGFSMHQALQLLMQLSVLVIMAGTLFHAQGYFYKRSFARWMEHTFPNEWARQSWTARKLVVNGALSALRRGGLRQDPDFERRYQELKRRERRILYYVALGAIFIAAAVGGTRLFGWQW